MASSLTVSARAAPLIHAAIIDLDGTLIDTLADFVVALNGMLADLRLPPATLAEVARRVGKGSEHLIRATLAHATAHAHTTASTASTAHSAQVESLFPEAMAAYQRHYLAVNGQHSRVFPGAVACLTALRERGLPLACLTNKPTAFARPLLAQKGLAGFFDHVFGGDAFERKKPDPLPVQRACAALGTEPAHTLVVGDSVNDSAAGRAAGCPVVLVSHGYNHGQPIREVPAHAWVDSLAEVPGLFSWACPAARL